MTNITKTAVNLVIYLMTITHVFAQNSPFPNPEIMISDDMNLKSIYIHNINQNLGVPYAKLGEMFAISFDDLDNDQKNYFFSVEHYDSNWEKSDIFETDYIEGYNEGSIKDYAYSFNSLEKYTHYSFRFPTNGMRLLISGNYLLKVYLDDPSEPAFVRRFVVYEDIITIGAKVDRATIVSKRDTEHQLKLVLNHKDLNIDNPAVEIKVNIIQNNTWDNGIYDLKYQYLGNNTLLYNYNDKMNFSAGNYFYRFDTKAIQTAGLFTDYIRLEDIYHTFLYTNEPRYEYPYSSQQDYNGGFVLRTIDSENTDTEGDYTNIHFSLKTDIQYRDKDIYIYGAFNDWRLEEDNKLVFNKDYEVYEASILLKQGYYDYKYVAVDKKTNEFLPDAISGSFYQTENNYSIIVYYRSMDSRTDRVVGFYQLRSLEMF
ncbi:MAG: DUF5103 domain-containing protein [Flavobacteriales bacterium]|nr:DUF5103 domain-containing protein [Flavobacteriales bacterium]